MPAADALEADALVLVVSGLASPGNLGALARSAEAAGARMMCIVRGGASPWNPKALRGSMGSLLRLPVVLFEDVRAATAWLAREAFRTVVPATRGGLAPGACDWSGRVAVWIGGETGDAPVWQGATREKTGSI